MLDELRELLLVSFFIFIHQLTHVVSNMGTHDVLTVNFGVEILGFGIVAGETLGAVGNVNSTIDGSLHGAEDASTGGGAGQTDIEASAECTWSIVNIFNIEDSSSNFSAALVDGVQLELLQQLQENVDSLVIVLVFQQHGQTYSSCEQKSSTVCSSIVSQPNLDTVVRKFMTVCSTNNHVSFNTSVRYLQDNNKLKDENMNRLQSVGDPKIT